MPSRKASVSATEVVSPDAERVERAAQRVIGRAHHSTTFGTPK
jgi:hypothetical protein